MKKHNIIVIGGSTGSLNVLKDLAGKLPQDFSAAVFVVWHLSPESPGILPQILERNGLLPAVNAVDNEKFESGRIYVAPPDHHLLIEDGHIRVTKGPKENLFRPAIDPLFRSAAYWHNSNVIGVILSGGLDDGTSGLWAIKERGGTTIVQDPFDAENPSMPSNALKKVRVDFCVPHTEIAELLIRLVSEEVKEEEGIKRRMNEEDVKTEIEMRIASEHGALENNVVELGNPSHFACPECHGVLLEITEGDIVRFRCHTGHAYSSSTLLSAITESIETSLWNAIRALEENIMLLNHLSKHLKDSDKEISEIYAEEAQKINRRLKKVREAVLEDL